MKKDMNRKKAISAVRNILEKSGGQIKVGYELNLTQFAFRSWIDWGIPENYWKYFMEKGIEVEELIRANQIIKQSK